MFHQEYEALGSIYLRFENETYLSRDNNKNVSWISRCSLHKTSTKSKVNTGGFHLGKTWGGVNAKTPTNQLTHARNMKIAD